MIKRKKKANINGNPLDPITIAVVKNSKLSFVGIIILFALFGAIIYYLPEIGNYYEYYIKGNTASLNINNTVVQSNSTNENTSINDNENSKETNIYYKFKETDVIELEDINITDIKLIDNNLSFNIVNKSKQDYVLNNYFLELYINNALDKRIMIEGTINKDEQKSFNYKLTNSPDSFSFKTILEKDYDYVDLNMDENHIGNLICTNDSEKITYVFKDYKLTKVKQEIKYEKSQSDYENVHNVYKKLVSKYRSLFGVTTNLKQDEKGLMYNLEIDYDTATSRIEDVIFYDKDVDPNVISFEMNSKFYSCK